jgi:hypothetical protein
MTPVPAFAILIGANHVRSETMPKRYLEPGEHEIMNPAVDWRVEYDPDRAASVRLIASARYQPIGPTLPGSLQLATTLVIHTDQAAAMKLFWQIRELARSMGWPLPPEDESRA